MMPSMIDFKKYYFYCPSNKCKISYTFNQQYPFSALKQLQFRTIRFMYFYQLLSECHMAMQNNPASLFWLTLFVCLFVCLFSMRWGMGQAVVSAPLPIVSLWILYFTTVAKNQLHIFFLAILKHKKEIQEFCK